MPSTFRGLRSAARRRTSRVTARVVQLDNVQAVVASARRVARGAKLFALRNLMHDAKFLIVREHKPAAKRASVPLSSAHDAHPRKHKAPSASTTSNATQSHAGTSGST